jgi:hypothetical protein
MKERIMNARSFLNKALLLVPVVLVAPLLASASPTPSCTDQTVGPSFGDTLTLATPVSFPDTTDQVVADATFNCTGVTFTSSFFFGSSDVVSTVLAGFSISSDVTTFPFNLIGDNNVVFTGFTGPGMSGPINFYVSDGPGLNQETVSMTPEPRSILLFGTGLLIAGGFIRRRLVSQTLA